LGPARPVLVHHAEVSLVEASSWFRFILFIFVRLLFLSVLLYDFHLTF
jgi:hypothetical protein